MGYDKTSFITLKPCSSRVLGIYHDTLNFAKPLPLVVLQPDRHYLDITRSICLLIHHAIMAFAKKNTSARKETKACVLEDIETFLKIRVILTTCRNRKKIYYFVYLIASFNKLLLINNIRLHSACLITHQFETNSISRTSRWSVH